MVGTRVYVGGLAYGTRERDIEKFFRGYGRIREVLLKNGYGFVEFDDHRDADDAVYELNGRSLLGERIMIERAHGVPRRGGFGGFAGNRRRPFGARNNKVNVEMARGGARPFFDRGMGRGGRRGMPSFGPRHNRMGEKYGPPTRTDYRLRVENLSTRISWQDLKDFMRQAGEVTYADAHKQKRNEGVVEFANYGDLKNALDKLDGADLNGRKIKLVDEKSRRRSRSSSSRSRSRSRSRSQSRSRSRSRSRSGSRSSKSSRSRSRSASRSKSPEADKKKESRSVEKSEKTEDQNGGKKNGSPLHNHSDSEGGN